MSEKQTKRLRRLRRLAATGGPELLMEAYKRFGGDEEATLKWLMRTMREVATIVDPENWTALREISQSPLLS